MQRTVRSIIRINKCLTDNLDDKEIASTLDKLTKHVPYRFLSPWINTASFVAHDQLWNLIPADISVNSSKSDRLPILEKYLPRLAEEHRNAIVGIFTQRFA